MSEKRTNDWLVRSVYIVIVGVAFLIIVLPVVFPPLGHLKKADDPTRPSAETSVMPAFEWNKKFFHGEIVEIPLGFMNPPGDYFIVYVRAINDEILSKSHYGDKGKRVPVIVPRWLLDQNSYLMYKSYTSRVKGKGLWKGDFITYYHFNFETGGRPVLMMGSWRGLEH